MDAHELLAIARRDKPHIHYTQNKRGDAVAARHADTEPWIMVAGLCIDGSWGCWGKIGNVSINGKLLNTQEDWLDEQIPNTEGAVQIQPLFIGVS